MMNAAEFDNIARAERDFWWYRGMRRILSGVLEPVLDGRPIGRALEAGCGTGYQALLFERERGWSLYPVDLGWNGLRYARQMGLDRLAQADIARLPFASGSFDAVFSLDVIVHFPRGQEVNAARELVRVLKPKGLLVLRVSALNALRSRHSQFACERQRFTRRRLMETVKSQGVRVLRCTYANSLLLPVALAKFRIWEPLWRKPPASGVAPVPGWLDRLLYLPLALESVWLRAGFDSPLGQSLVLVGEKT
ncbi:MAG: class I SAM-dependent methyltransferase [Bryobacteraceae bacterium]